MSPADSPTPSVPVDAPPPARGGPPGVPAGRIRAWALGAGLLAGLAAWLGGEAVREAFRPKLVRMDTMLGPMDGATTEEREKADARNAALAFGLLGAGLGLALGVAGGLARRDPRRAAVAGAAGAALGALLAVGAALALQPLYYQHAHLDPTEQDLVRPLAVHLGIWAAAGLAGGAAFGLGLGGGRVGVGRAALGGLVGAALAAVIYEVAGSLLFPAAETLRPVSLTPQTRFLARALVALLAGLGAAMALTNEPARRRRAA
jgi:hypothetical protein